LFGRRLLILVAVLLGLTTLASTVAPPPPRAPRQAAPTSTATPEDGLSGAEGGGQLIEQRIDAAAGGAETRVRAREGDTVVLHVSSDVIDTVVIDDLADSEQVEPAVPAVLEIVADTPGSFPVRLLDARREIGVLEVEPAA
jgi:hypothetical protein